MHTLRRAGGILALILILIRPADAGTWRVGRLQSDCPGGCQFYDNPPGVPAGGGIAAAMASPSVVAGDTVRVWPGTYGIRFTMKSNVKLISDQGPTVTNLQGVAGQEPMCVLSGTGTSTLISGFTIKWNAQPTGVGGGIAAFVASGTVRNNIFRECIAGIGSGVYLQFADLVVEDNLFLNNRCDGGGGVVAATGGSPVIRNNTFYGSIAPFGYQGAAFYASGSGFTFEKNVVTASMGGTAVYCAGVNTGTLSCNLVWDNEMGAFGGTCVDSTGTSGNISADPLLCNPAGGDFGMCSDSPALSAACGPIGYASPGGNCAPCGPNPVAAGLETASWGTIKARYR